MRKTLYILTLFVALLATSNLSQAQKKNNWFVGVGLGGNILADNGKISPLSPAGTLYVGDWFKPSLGFRAGLSGILGRPADARNNWFSENTAFGLYQLYADFLWNIRNTFIPYKSNRVWNPVLYARLDGILASSLGVTKGHVGIGGGLANQFRVSDFMSISLDVNAVLTSEKAFRTDHSGGFLVVSNVSLGVVFDLGNRGF
jgi:hypothetical protein